MSVDEEFGISLDPCEHPSINGTVCAACGATCCAVCEFAVENGWTGLPTGTSHCRRCHKQWTGTRAAHCPMCCRTFTSDSAAQLHKRSEGPRLVCVPPETVVDEWDRPLFRPSGTAGAEWALADLPKMDAGRVPDRVTGPGNGPEAA